MSLALKLYERARDIKEATLGKDHVGVAIVLNNLAATYQSQGINTLAVSSFHPSSTTTELIVYEAGTSALFIM